MRRSLHGRPSTGRGPGRRVVVALATLATFGGLIGITQISRAETSATPTPTPTATGGNPGDGLQILGDTCDGSDLRAHNGFQEGDRCVSTEFGEVAPAAQNPTLLITDAPETVRVGQPFRLTVSTRNLVRDRFLPAGQGGYYLESAFLTEEGLTRGHFHTACRMLTSTSEAVDPAPVPAFFVATEDGQGGAEPDSVTIQVSGLPAEGIAQCAAWAGDGSHRIPMMQRANQVPALDAVRIEVRAGDGAEPPAEDPPAQDPPAGDPPAGQPPVENPDAEDPRGDDPDDQGPAVGQPGPQTPAAGQPGRDDEPGRDEEPGRDDNPGQEPDQQEPGAGQQPDRDKPEPGRTPGGKSPAAEEEQPEKPAESPAAAAAAGGEAGNDEGQAGGTPADDSAGGLAFTGVNTTVLFTAGALLIIAGIAITYLTRQRRYRASRR